MNNDENPEKLAFIYHKFKIAYINIPKNASTTIRRLIGNQEGKDRVYFSDIPSDYKILIIIRNPITRAYSSYKEILKCRKDGNYQKTQQMSFYKQRNNPEKSFSSFLKEIRDDNYDIHSRCQSKFLETKGISLKDVDYVIPFEYLEKGINFFLPFDRYVKLGHKNKSNPPPFNLYKYEKEIRKAFSSDFELYDEAVKLWKEYSIE